MRSVLALACLVLLTSALAGCSAGDPERFPDGVAGGTSTSTGPASNGTSTGPATSSSTGTSGDSRQDAPNQAPSISITVAGNRSGSAPFNVTFLLNGTDAEGDALQWTLAFGDGSANATGTALPAEVDHVFAAAGNFTANFTASDGTGETSALFAIEVVNGTVAYNGPPPIVFSGESANYGDIGCGGAVPGTATYHDFDGALAGVWKFKASPATMITEWWTADASSENAGAEGVIPADRDNVAVCPTGGPGGVAYPAQAYTLTLYHPDDSPPADEA
jgi:hypothetical protein